MSLFEKVKNIRRNNLQEKRKFPGDESGAYKRAKDDLEARKGFSKNKPGGLKADEKNPFVKRSVRKTRVDKLGGDIYDAPKFSQKKFDKSIGGAKKPTSPAAPGLFGKGDTKGQMNVKGMEKKAFKKTQPSDIKLPKSFTDFQRNLQDFKDRDQPGGPRKSPTKSKTSGTPLTRQDVGMAPPDKPKVVKQSEVSKKAKDFTKQINQNRTSPGTPMRKGATTIPKDVSKNIQVGKMRDRVNQLVGEREKMRSVTGKKDVKGMRTVNKQIKQYQQSIKSNPFAPTVYDPKNKSTTTGTTGSSKVTRNLTRGKKPYVTKTTVTGDTLSRGRPKNYEKSKGSSIPNRNKNSMSYYKSQGRDAFDLTKNPTSQGKPIINKGEPQLPKFTKTTNPSYAISKNTSGFDSFYSDKAYKAARKLPKPVQKIGKSKAVQKILKTAIKNPYVAAGAAIVGTAAAGYGAYKAYKALTKDKTKLKYKDFKSLSTPSDPDKGKIIHTRDIPKKNIKKGDVARFSSSSKIPKSSSAEFKSNYAYK